MKNKKQQKRKNINVLGKDTLIGRTDFVYDFSKMSLDELLESARADYEPHIPGDAAATANTPGSPAGKAPAIPAGASGTKLAAADVPAGASKDPAAAPGAPGYRDH